MHLVHYLDPVRDKEDYDAGWAGAVQGVVFDTMYYDKDTTEETIAVVDKFFDSLQMDKISPDGVMQLTSPEIPLGELMSVVSTNKRWVYTGSLTTPPCSEKIYWNVAARILPMKPRHLQLFRSLLLGYKYKNNLSEMTMEGNFREIQEIKDQDPKLMIEIAKEDVSYTNMVLLILLLFVLANVAIEIGFLYTSWKRKKDAAEQKK